MIRYLFTMALLLTSVFSKAQTATELGPKGLITSSLSGIGRFSSIAFHPTDSNYILLGAHMGGLWESTDAGANWANLNTDTQFDILAVGSIAIDQSDPNVIYASTGTTLSYRLAATGVYRTLDKGLSWTKLATGLPLSQGFYIEKVLINPTNANEVFLATSKGLYKTSAAKSGSVSWTLVDATGTLQSQSIKNVLYRPGSSTVMFASGAAIWQSNDAGVTWAAISTSGIAQTPPYNCYMDISTSNPSIMYTNISKGGVNYFYRYDPVNPATPWSLKRTKAISSRFTRICVHPANDNLVYIGEDRLYRYNAATNTTNDLGYSGTYFHADYEGLAFSPHYPNILFSVTDGMMSKLSTTTNSFLPVPVNYPGVAQCYGMTFSPSNPDWLLTGTQDDGNFEKSIGSSTWKRSNIVGDGYKGNCFLGTDKFTTGNSGSTSGIILKNNSFTSVQISQASSITPSKVNPNQFYTAAINSTLGVSSPASIYDLYKYDNGTNTWDRLSDLGNGLGKVNQWNLVNFELSPNDEKKIYCYTVAYNIGFVSTGLRPSQLFKTTVGGKVGGVYQWSQIASLDSPMYGSAFDPEYPLMSISGLAMSSFNDDHVWVSFGGSATMHGDFTPYNYGAPSRKIFVSKDGGTTWATEVLTGLPYLAPNCIAYEKYSNDRVYVGTDAGIYYKDASMSSWQKLNNGFPNAMVRELKIDYQNKMLLAATYGRGLWKMPLVCPAVTALNVTGLKTAPLPNIFETGGTITSAVNLGSSSEVLFTAGQSIEMTPGFEYTAAASGFTGVINPCTLIPGYSPRMASGGENLISQKGEEPESFKTKEVTINVFPNPCTDILNVKTSDTSLACTNVYLLDMNGVNVATAKFDSELQTTFTVSTLTSGTYLVKTEKYSAKAEKIVVRNNESSVFPVPSKKED